MLEAIAKLGLSGGVGALIGMVAVWWVEPTTSQGAILLLFIAIIFSVVVGGVISYFFGSRNDPAVKSEEELMRGRRVRGIRADPRRRPRVPRS